MHQPGPPSKKKSEVFYILLKQKFQKKYLYLPKTKFYKKILCSQKTFFPIFYTELPFVFDFQEGFYIFHNHICAFCFSVLQISISVMNILMVFTFLFFRKILIPLISLFFEDFFYNIQLTLSYIGKKYKKINSKNCLGFS